MSDIVVLGSLNADLVVTAKRAPAGGETVTGEGFRFFNGGKGANQAFAAARLGASVSMLGRVGADAYGRALVEGLVGEGVDVAYVRSIENSTTGVAVITVERGGENRIVVVPGANGAYSVSEVDRDAEAFAGAKLALFQLETPIETVRRAHEVARGAGCLTVLDPAPAGALDSDLLGYVDYLTPNLSELSVLSQIALAGNSSDAEIEAAARRLLERGVGKVIAKLGSRGAMLVSGAGVERIEALPVEAVDSTAAGDCFNGAFAAALSRGEGEVAAIRFACAAAAVSVTRMGAQVSMPRLEEIDCRW